MAALSGDKQGSGTGAFQRPEAGLGRAGRIGSGEAYRRELYADIEERSSKGVFWSIRSDWVDRISLCTYNRAARKDVPP